MIFHFSLVLAFADADCVQDRPASSRFDVLIEGCGTDGKLLTTQLLARFCIDVEDAFIDLALRITGVETTFLSRENVFRVVKWDGLLFRLAVPSSFLRIILLLEDDPGTNEWVVSPIGNFFGLLASLRLVSALSLS